MYRIGIAANSDDDTEKQAQAAAAAETAAKRQQPGKEVMKAQWRRVREREGDKEPRIERHQQQH